MNAARRSSWRSSSEPRDPPPLHVASCAACGDPLKKRCAVEATQDSDATYYCPNRAGQMGVERARRAEQSTSRADSSEKGNAARRACR
jgi:hypothetical protein